MQLLFYKVLNQEAARVSALLCLKKWFIFLQVRNADARGSDVRKKVPLCGINASAITFDHAKLRAENSQI